MKDRLDRMNCYLLAGGEENEQDDFTLIDDITRLEKSYRGYARLFEKVTLVIKKKQASEHYLNYPYVCDEHDSQSAVIGVAAALKSSSSEIVFVGSTKVADFPLEKALNLIKKYNGEPFLGYRDETTGDGEYLFGIYRKDVLTQLQNEIGQGELKLADLLKDQATLL